MNLGRDSLAPFFVTVKGRLSSYLSPYCQTPSISTHWKQYVRDGIIALGLATALVSVFVANSATYTFAQSNWSGGETANNANHASNRTGWNQYASKDSTTALMNGGADVEILAVASSTSQTSSVDFNLGTLSSVTVSGGGVGANVILTNSTAAPAWELVAPLPSGAGDGSFAVYPGSGDYIYQLLGGDASFYRYSISTNSWTILTSIPVAVGLGGSLAYPGSGDYIYAFRGGSSKTFYRYSISQNTWTSLAAAPANVNEGGSLVFGGGDYLYAYRGYNGVSSASSTDFWRYSISGNSWTAMASTTEGQAGGTKLVYTGGDYIYGWQGTNAGTTLYRYSISQNTWTPMVAMYGNRQVSYGSALAYPGSGDYIYAFRGGGNGAEAYRYSISGNSWEQMSSPLGVIYSGSSLVVANGYLFGSRSGGSTDFMRALLTNVVSGSGWTAVASTTAQVYSGGALVYPLSGDYLYAYSAGNTTNFYRYSILGNSWSTMSAVPGVVGNGGSSLVSAGGDYIYGTRGNTNVDFYRYSISVNSWTTLNPLPKWVWTGSQMVYTGSGDYIYMTRGGGTSDFFRYSISTDTWVALASSTVNFTSGSSLVYPGSGDYLYATRGQGTNNFYRYSISQNTWTTRASTPINMYSGANLVYPGSGDYIYAITGNDTSSVYRYSISQDSWLASMSSVPTGITGLNDGAYFAYPGGSFLYLLRGNGTKDFYRFAEKSFAASGTFTSSVIDTGNRSVFTTLNYTASTPTGTGLTVDVRAGNTATPDGSWTAWQPGIVNGGSISVLNDNRYVQYRVSLTSSDVSVTPSFADITFNYATYASSTTLTSSPFDSSSSGNILASVRWSESLPSGTAVKFQLRSAPNAAGVPGVWSGWMGPDGTDATYFTASNGSQSMPTALTDATNDQWFQYKVFLTTTRAATPTLSDVTITYVVNAPPEFDTSFGTQGSTATQIATSSDPNWGKVYIQYKVRDPDTTTGSNTSGFVSPSFEYDIGGGWVSIPADKLSANATANKTVSEGAYTLYEAYFDAAAFIPNTYYASARIRVKVNDNEGANNLAYAITPSFVLDTKAPTISSTHIDGTSSTSTVTFAATDDTTIGTYILSNSSNHTADGVNASSGITQAVNSASTSVATSWTLSTGSSTKTVHLKITDERGNIATRSAVIPTTPSNIEYRDLSNVDTGTYRIFVAWNLYPDPVPEGAPFESYKLYRSTDGSSFSLAYTSTNPAINYFLDTSVATSTTYYYKVVFTTSNGDRTPYSPTVSDAPDGKGGSNNGAIPLISSITVTDIKNTSAKITWTTDDLALSEVDFGTTNSYGQVASNRSYVTSHGVYLTSLTPNTQYYYRVRSIDAFSGTATDSNNGSGYTFTTGGGPVVSNVTTSSISDTTADIAWRTNIAADSHVSYSTSPTLATYTVAGSDTFVASPFQHKVTISGLTTDTLYYYKVTSKDESGNITIDDNNGSFYTFRTTYDVKSPVITSVSVPVKASDGAVITWTTDELSTSKVEYGTASGTSSAYMFATTEITTPSIFHSVTLSSETTKEGGGANTLVKKTQYFFRVKSVDQAGNSAYSGEGTFATTEDGAVTILGGGYSSNNDNKTDTTKPVISDLQITNIGPFGATVSFTTNEDTRAIVQYGENIAYTGSAADPALSQSHKVTLKGLKMGTAYHLAASAVDKSGNVTTSSDRTFSTSNIAEDLGALSTLEQGLDGLQEKIENLIESALPSINPPFIEKPMIEEVGEDFARISWRTNVKAYGSVSYAEESEYVKNQQYISEAAKTQEKNTEHIIDLLGLKSNTRYHFKATSYVFPGATAQTSDMTFVTKAGRVQAQVRDRKKDSMRIVWDTTIPTTSVVTYKVRGSQMVSRKMDEGMTTSHDILLDNLRPATTYEIRAYGLTEDGNTVEARDTIVASTNEDTTPPAISNFKVDSALVPGRTDRTQTIVSWKTDEPATSVVYYDEGSGSATAKLSQVKDSGMVYTDNHVVILTNLKPGTIYRFQIVSTDDANNQTKLPVRTIVTPSQSESVVDIIFKNFDETFKFMRTVR